MTRTSWRPFGGQSKFSALLAALATALTLQGCGGDDIECGGPFCVSPGPPEATTLKADSGAGQTGAPGRELPKPIVVLVTDDDDRPIADVQVSFSVGQGGGSVSEATIQSDINGRARVSWTLGPDAGTQSLQAAATTSSGAPLDGSPLSISANAVRPPPHRIVLHTPPPETARNGAPFERQPVIEVLDADDQPIPQVQVTAAIATGGGTLSGTTSVSSDTVGRATYTDLGIVGAIGARTLRFSVIAPALEVASGTIQVEAGSVSELEGVSPVTYQGTVSSPVSPPPSVIARDAAGNPVPGVTITFTPDRDASVSPTTVVTDEDGLAQLTSWTLGRSSDGQYSLTAGIASAALTPVTFSASARAGTAGGLQILTQPSASAQNGIRLSVQPVIQVTDRNGNPTPQADILVAASVTTGSGTLANARVRTDGSGQARFSGLTLTGMVGNYTISFGAPNLGGVASTPIALTAGAAAKLALVSAAPTARSQHPLSPQPAVQVQDASGNPIAQAGIQIAAAMAGDGTLGGTTTVPTDANGLATFSDLAITGLPGSRTLNFSSVSPVLEGVSVSVTLPAVTLIEVQPPAPPASAVVGSTISVAWALKDAEGQPVADVPVSLGASAGTLVPSASATSGVNGVVQVQWTLGTIAGDQLVEIVVSGGGPTSQLHVVATPAAADSLAKISGDNQTAPVNSELPELLVVRVVDLYGNGVPNMTVEWRACEGDGFNGQTDDQGYSSSVQPTGPQPSQPTFCTRASVSGLKGSPVEFTYTVTAAPSPSQLRSSASGPRPLGPAPVAPSRMSRVSPNSR